MWQGACIAGGVCMAGGMHGGGHVWQGACMAGGAWQGVHGGGHAWQGVYMAGGVSQEKWPLQWAVCILLECILVKPVYSTV